jgi:plastocyanin
MSDVTSSGTRAERKRPLTTRRGFIAVASLGTVSLYGLWAAYGAAPFRLFGGDHDDGEDAPQHEPAPEAGGHGGHGAAARGPTVDEFRRESEAFVARHRQPDGSVRVDAESAPPAAAMADHGAHGAGHEMPAMSASDTGSAPADVYLLVQQWSFEPDVLRLRAGVPYRFRMMAVDVAHGASLQLGPASRIVRLRQGVLVEQEITFTKTGEYLVYCTLYCGVGHDRMSGRIIVT